MFDRHLRYNPGAMARALDFEADLNPEQLAAVSHGEGPQLVLAGAGSGKTRVITYRIAWLIQRMGVDPARIVAVTFTNKAAGEMRDRVEALLGSATLPTFVGTFHRFALRLLRRSGERVGLRRDFAILDATDQLALVREALAAESLAESAFPPRAVLAAISAAKSRLVDASRYEREADTFFRRKVAQVYRRYQGLLHRASGIDFDDMIALAVRLMANEPEFKERLRARTHHLLVDEFQDTNHAQLRLVRDLAGAAGNLTAVGDEDQGIYRWRGADLDNVLNFEASFPGAAVRKLERNYRSTQTILDASGSLVANNRLRRGKRLWTEAGAGEKVELYKARDERDEAAWIVNTLLGLGDGNRPSDLAILVRTNAQTRALEEELLRLKVPYTLVGGVRFYDRAEIKDLVAYLRVVRNPRDEISFDRILNQPPRGIGKATQEFLQQQAEALGQSRWDLLRLDELGGFPARSAAALSAFRDLILDLKAQSSALPLPAFLQVLLDRTGYADLYRKDNPEDQARLENIREFLSAAQEFTEAESYNAETDDLLTAFLDHVSLVTDLDGWRKEGGVSLMTLHSAKGLEFPAVAVAGLEDGLLPHYNAQATAEEIEEERRLLYVGMTRARARLFLTCCRRRRIAGRYQDQTESRFLSEIPEHLLAVSQSPTLFDPREREAVYSFLGRDRRWSEQPGGDPGGEAAGEGRAPAKGQRVRHATLGQGVILDTEGEGESAKLTVFFDRAGKKKLIARFAKLEYL